MKIAIVVLLVLFSFTTNAQTSKECYERGLKKIYAKDYQGSLAEFDRVIRMDPQYPGAYYNRGTTKIYLNDFKGAIEDFDNAAKFAPTDRQVFSNRGVARLSSNDPQRAILDFDIAISLDAASARDYFMRGQAKLGINDKGGGCKDLNRAKELGHIGARKYIDEYCKDTIEDLRESANREFLRIDWPNEEGWKIASNQVSGMTKIIELLRNNETFENWTEIGTMIVYSSPGNMPPIEEAMDFMVKQATGKCPTAVATFLEKDEKAQNPWIIFKIESGTENPESQVWQIIEGNQDMFVNFRAVKQRKVPEDLKVKWVKFFKTARVIKS